MEGGPQQYLSHPPVYFKSNPDPALTRIIVGRGIPDMFNFWSEIDGQGVIRHKKGTCGSKELPEFQIIQHLKDFTGLLTAAYQPIIHIFLYHDKMTYVTQDKKLFKSTAQVFLIISRKKLEEGIIMANLGLPDNITYSDLPIFIMQVCVYYKIEQWKISPSVNVFQVPDFLNQFLEGNITDNQMQAQGFILQMRIYGSYVMGMPLPDWRVNQLGLPPLNIIGDDSICKPMEYTTQCRIVEYLRLQDNISVKVPTVLIENYYSVAHRHSANFPFNIIYGLTFEQIKMIYRYREDNAVIREKSINTDNDLDFLDREIQTSTGAAAAAIQADIQAAKIPRFLTIEYPFFVEEMGDVAIDPGDVNRRNRTLTEVGKQKLLSSVQKVKPISPQIADPTRQNSFNKTLNLLKTVNEKIIGGIQQGINSIRTFTIQLKDSDGGAVEISGGRKTRKNKMKKTNKNKKQYKNKRHTNKRKKCKQLMRKTMNRKM